MGRAPLIERPAALEPTGKLRWRCRRGMKELDILLTGYLDDEYLTAPSAQQQAFRRLLDCQDPLIHAYLLGQQLPPNAELAAVIERITANSLNDTRDDR